MSIHPTVKGGGHIPAALRPLVEFIMQVCVANGWSFVTFWLKLQPAEKSMNMHTDSISRNFDESLVARITPSGDGGFLDLIDASNANVVDRVHL